MITPSHNGWRSTSISEIATVVRGSSPRPAKDPRYFNGSFLPWITVGDIVNSSGPYLERTESMLTEEGAKQTRIMEVGTFLLTNSGARTLGVPKITRIRAGANDGVAALLNLAPCIDLEFLFYQLQSQTTFLRQRVAAGNDQLNLNTDLIGAMRIQIPPLPEQKKIAAILSTWDRAIELTEKLIAAKQKLKQALMQQLLTGKVRLPEFSKQKWKLRKIGEFLNESRVVGANGEDARKITVKLYGKGVLPKTETRKGSSATQYYRRFAGQFIYSKLDFLNGAFGIVPSEMDGFESTLDLPAFDVSAELDIRWLLAFVSREQFYSRGFSLANGGRKARRVNPKDFLNIKIKMPDFAEQQSVANLIELANREVQIMREKLTAVSQQKNGLMQQLLTGKVRVKANP